MPSFDIVSEFDMHELTNAVDQANREVSQRFDFKGVDAKFEQKENVVTMHAQVEFQIDQMLELLKGKLVKRKIDVTALKVEDLELVGQRAQQKVIVQQGVETEVAKKIQKHVKDLKMKVQISIQGDKLRVTGNKRDDLQAVIANLRQQNFGLPLQFDNFRD
ncbi:MAG: YajQ family cyclic di-GMP-binding protein [Gammaproteobacteria bacterium]